MATLPRCSAAQSDAVAAMTSVFGAYQEAFPDVQTLTTAHMRDAASGQPFQNASQVR